MMRAPIIFALISILVGCVESGPQPTQVRALKAEHDTSDGLNRVPQLTRDEITRFARKHARLRQDRRGRVKGPEAKNKNRFKEVSEFTDDKLRQANEHQVAVVVKNRLDLDRVARQISDLGFPIQGGLIDRLVVGTRLRGVLGLRDAQSRIGVLPEVLAITPRFRPLRLPAQRKPLSVPTAVPSDPYFDIQWGLGAIGAPVAWGYESVRNASLTIAVVDNGVANTHPDLAPRLVQGRRTSATVTNLFGFFPSWDDPDTDDYTLVGHGTAVAGIVGAVTNNGVGVSGAAWNGSIMPMAVNEPKESDTIQYSDNTRAAVMWAIDNGAKVINLSLGSEEDEAGHFAAMADYALERGVPLICATGNSGQLGVRYPARLVHQNVIGVGGHDSNYYRVSSSSYGPGLDLLAPGTNIWTTLKSSSGNMTYGPPNVDGTSLAAPFVAGAFASLWGAAPALPYWEISEIILSTTEGAGSDGVFYPPPSVTLYTGFGRLSFGNAAAYMHDAGLVYRWRDDSLGTFGWTNQPDEQLGSTYEGVAFRLEPTSTPSTMPLYRKLNTTTNDRILTRDPLELNTEGYVTEGDEIGYIASDATSVSEMSSALFRMYNCSLNRHIFTASMEERDRLVLEGWSYEGSIGYVYSD